MIGKKMLLVTTLLVGAPAVTKGQALDVGLSLGYYGAAAYDAHTTVKALGRGGHELNPVMRPLVGTPARAHTAMMAMTTGHVFLLNKYTSTKWSRWAKVVMIGLHTGLALHNRRVR